VSVVTVKDVNIEELIKKDDLGAVPPRHERPNRWATTPPGATRGKKTVDLAILVAALVIIGGLLAWVLAAGGR
jgi:hypothetical protein